MDNKIRGAKSLSIIAENLKDNIDQAYTIGRDKFRDSQLPQRIRLAEDIALERPPTWF